MSYKKIKFARSYIDGREKDIPGFVMENIYDLRNERTARYMSQVELAEKTGVSKKEIYSYENMYKWPGPGNYNRLAIYFGWPLWKIIRR